MNTPASPLHHRALGRLWWGVVAGLFFLAVGIPMGDWRTPARLTPTRLDLNTASPAELCQLPGIGPALAEAIVRDRQSHGLFRDIDDLERVPGIGEKKSAQLSPYVEVVSR